jgi:hypothetical protein
MKNFVLFILFFLIGIVSVIGYYSINGAKSNYITKQAVKKLLDFNIATAPKETLKGTIVSLTGSVKWESRIATAPAQLTKTISIQQGESVLTENDGAVTINFSDAGLVNISAKSQVDIIQTLPTNIVFNQKKGSVTYQKTSQIPLAIRSLHLLTMIDNGQIRLIIDEENSTILVTVISGQATIAFNDLQYLSHIINLNKGQEYLFDDINHEGSVN